MANSAFVRLQRVLDLEEKQGWRNRAVIGGIPAMGERWADDAADEGAAPEVVAAVLALFDLYDAGDEDARPEIGAALRSAMNGELAPATA